MQLSDELGGDDPVDCSHGNTEFALVGGILSKRTPPAFHNRELRAIRKEARFILGCQRVDSLRCAQLGATRRASATVEDSESGLVLRARGNHLGELGAH